MESKRNRPPSGVVIAMVLIILMIIVYMVLMFVFPDIFDRLMPGEDAKPPIDTSN